MPRFYFDTREGSRFTPDEEGVEFPDLDAAEREAATAAAECLTSALTRQTEAVEEERVLGSS